MTCHASRLIGLSALSFMLLIHAAWTPTIQSAQLEPLGGTITSDGVAMEGVVVSARLDRSTVTTTVFTDARGVYRFPALADGNHHVWAQAEGFATARATATVSIRFVQSTGFHNAADHQYVYAGVGVGVDGCASGGDERAAAHAGANPAELYAVPFNVGHPTAAV